MTYFKTTLLAASATAMFATYNFAEAQMSPAGTGILPTSNDIIYNSTAEMRDQLAIAGATVSTVDLKLDYYAPSTGCTPGTSSNRPFVVLIHGGGFTAGNKQDLNLRKVASHLTGTGYNYAVFSVSYRLANLGTSSTGPTVVPVPSSDYEDFAVELLTDATLLPLSGLSSPDTDTAARTLASVAAVEDVTNAIQYIYDNASTYCVIKDRYAILGSSAGATIGHGVTYGLNDAPGGALPSLPAQPLLFIDFWGKAMVPGSIGTGEAPLLIYHGAQDDKVDFSEALAIRNDAADVSGRTFIKVENRKHGWCEMEPEALLVPGAAGRYVMEEVLTSVKKHLGPGSYNYVNKIIAASATTTC